MNTLKSLGIVIGKLLGDTIKLRAMEKADLRKTIKSTISRHERYMEVFSTFTPSTYKSIATKYVDIVKKSPIPTATIHDAYRKLLTGKAKSEEDKAFMSTLYGINKEYRDILIEINKNLDKLFDEEVIHLSNVRMSQVAALGIIRSAEIHVTWSMYWWAQFIKIANGIQTPPHKYRMDYLQENLKTVTNNVNHIYNHTGPYSFLNEADQLKRKDADFVLGAFAQGNFIGMLRPSNYTKGFFDNIETALSTLNIFRWGMEKWDDYLNECNKRNEEEYFWMQGYVALLKEDLRNMDHNDPKYKEQIKVIEAWDDLIADYDRKITAYRQGD